MRPAVWEYEAGEENAFHRQGSQEELYVVLEGAFDVTIELDDDREVLAVEEGDYLACPSSYGASSRPTNRATSSSSVRRTWSTTGS